MGLTLFVSFFNLQPDKDAGSAFHDSWQATHGLRVWTPHAATIQSWPMHLRWNCLMHCSLYWTRGLPVGSGIVKAPASASSGAGSKERGAADRKRAPTPCSPPDAASKTGAGPTSSIGGLAASQSRDQRKWTAPSHQWVNSDASKTHNLAHAARGFQQRPIKNHETCP